MAGIFAVNIATAVWLFLTNCDAVALVLGVVPRRIIVKRGRPFGPPTDHDGAAARECCCVVWFLSRLSLVVCLVLGLPMSWRVTNHRRCEVGWCGGGVM